MRRKGNAAEQEVERYLTEALGIHRSMFMDENQQYQQYQQYLADGLAHERNLNVTTATSSDVTSGKSSDSSDRAEHPKRLTPDFLISPNYELKLCGRNVKWIEVKSGLLLPGLSSDKMYQRVQVIFDYSTTM